MVQTALLPIDPTASVIVVDVPFGPKTVQLPLTTLRSGRVITIKDSGSCSSTRTITIQCAAGDTFETGGTTMCFPMRLDMLRLSPIRLFGEL